MNTYCTTLLFFWEEKNRRITRYCVSKWIYANNPESVSYFTLQSKRTALSHFFSCVQHLQTLAKNVKRSFQCAQNDLVEGFHILFWKFKHHSGIGPMQLRKTLSAIELQLFVNKASAQINIYVGKGLSVKSRIIGMWGCIKEKTAEYTRIGHIITYTCSTACWYQIASRSIKVHFNRQTQSRWPAEEKLNIGMWKNSDLSDFKHRTQLLVPDWLVQVFQKPLILKYPVSSSSVGKNVNVMVQKRMAKLQNRRLMMTLMSLDFRIWHKYHGSMKPSFQIQLLLVV